MENITKEYKVTQYLKVMRELTVKVTSEDQLCKFLNFYTNTGAVVTEVKDSVIDYDEDADCVLELRETTQSEIKEFSYVSQFTPSVLNTQCKDEDFEDDGASEEPNY